jgi:hypothetical protein
MVLLKEMQFRFWQSLNLNAAAMPPSPRTPAMEPPMMPPKVDSLSLDDEVLGELADGVLGELNDGLLGELDDGLLGELDDEVLDDAHTVEPCLVAEGHNVHDDGLIVFAKVPTGHITHLLKKGSLSKNASASQ